MESVKFSLSVYLSVFIFVSPIVSGSETTSECCFGVKCKYAKGRFGDLDTLRCNIDDTLPTFSYVPDLVDLELAGNVHTLPSNFFAKLKRIYKLTLIQTLETPPVKANWSDQLFENVKIDTLEVRNLDGLVPPPEALKALGRNGLEELMIYVYDGESVSLNSNVFSDFKSLFDLGLNGMPISKIDQAAFGGLEERLHELFLSSALTSSGFPVDALKSLVNLQYLDLTCNRLGHFPLSEISNSIELEILLLSGNQIQEALDAGTLTSLPGTLKELDLGYGGLTEVPVELLADLPDLTFLDLGDNLITALRDDAFSNNAQLLLLLLWDNPITSIGSRSFKHLAALEFLSLERTRLTSFDLSLFNGSNEITLLLDENPHLKALDGATKPDWGVGINYLSLRAVGIEKIDQKFKDLIELMTTDFNPNSWPRPLPSRIILSNNQYIACDESLEWMVEHVRAGRIRISNTNCANSTTLMKDYLKTKFPTHWMKLVESNE